MLIRWPQDCVWRQVTVRLAACRSTETKGKVTGRVNAPRAVLGGRMCTKSGKKTVPNVRSLLLSVIFTGVAEQCWRFFCRRKDRGSYFVSPRIKILHVGFDMTERWDEKRFVELWPLKQAITLYHIHRFFISCFGSKSRLPEKVCCRIIP